MSRKIKALGSGGVPGFSSLVIAAAFLLLLSTGVQAETFTFEGTWGQAGFNLIDQNPAGIEVVFSVPSMELLDVTINGEAMKEIIIPGVQLPNNAGAPNLPGTGRFIALPQGAQASFTLVDYRTEVFHNVNVAPAPVIPRDTDPVIVYQKDPSLYGVDAVYPESPVLLGDRSDMRGVDVIMLGITPFQYNPVTRDLTVYKDVRVRVDFIGGNGHFGDNRLRSRWWDPLLQEHLLNYASMPSIDYTARLHAAALDEDNVEYVIIVPNDPYFLAWADTLKNWRNQQGIITGITTLTEIGGNNATLIENYINNAYNTWQIPPVAVLLLSDYQSTGSDLYGITSPTWNGYCVSDNMYADVNGNDLPDLNIARITAQNGQQLQTMINKMLTYERNPYTDPGFYQNPLMAAGWQSDRWFVLCSEVVYGFLQNELGKTPTRQYAGSSGPPSTWSTNPNTYMIVNYFGPTGLGYIPNNPSYLTNWSGNAAGINAAINAGTFMVLHRDHGLETGWGTPAYSNTNVYQLTNTHYPYVFSLNCLTGKYNWGSECFAEAFHRLQYGALGLIAASEVSYSFVNDTYCWGMMDCMWPEFDPGYGNPNLSWNLRPGFANASGKYYLAASSWPYNPSNKDETNNLFHHHGDAFLTLYSEVPQNLTVTHSPAVMSGASNFTVTANAGSLIGLSLNGAYIGSADGTGGPVSIPIPLLTPGQTLRVTVTKANYYRYLSDVQVIPASGPYVVYNSCQINDAIVGNNNGQWDFGETTDLSIGVKNVGVQAANNVNVTISEIDPLVTVLDNQAAYGTINAGDSLTIANGFRVQADPATPDGHLVAFTLTATSGTSTWESSFSLLINAPIVVKDTLVIQDPTGNNNGQLDPGETTTFVLTMANDGHSTAQNVSVTMTCNNPQVTISGNPGAFGNINAGSTASDTYGVIADAGLPSGTQATFTLNITATGSYTNVQTFILIIGDVRNIPCGPDAYGYKAWDNLDGGEAHPYNWIEVAPQSGGTGTILTALNGDDQTTVVTLPFTFRYYGQDYTQASVCTNGWLALGSTTATAYTNTGIPNTGAPATFIAAFWDDMHCGQGGTQVATYYNSASHYVVVEWDSLAHYGAASTRETFEIILYDPAYWPTSTGDGIILVQYALVQNAGSATFGIENNTQNIGIQYGLNGVWHTNAWQVVAGRTITYTTNSTGPPPSVDVTLTPVSPPIQIPATGGSFNYNGVITNNGSSPATFDAWIMVQLPAGTWYGPVLGPLNLTLPATVTITRLRTQNVPASAPAGVFTYRGYVGIYSNTKWDSSSFAFTKLTTGDGPIVGNWDNFGDSFEPYLTKIEAATVPTIYALGQNYPNPFNPLTSISFSLPQAGFMKLAVYDLLGRQVALLVNEQKEAGIYQTTFDASNLASGIYLYRLEAGEFSAVQKMVLMK